MSNKKPGNRKWNRQQGQNSGAGDHTKYVLKQSGDSINLHALTPPADKSNITSADLTKFDNWEKHLSFYCFEKHSEAAQHSS